MPFDFKKEYKEFYMPPKKPVIVTVPSMNYIAVRGKGDPNIEGGEYKKAIELLYGIAYTIKMSKKSDRQIEGYFDYVVPPLEGFWWQEGIEGVDYTKKEEFNWISLIRLPDFVTKNDFDWAVGEAEKKKKTDFSKVEFLTYDEGLCVQCMHIGRPQDSPHKPCRYHQSGYCQPVYYLFVDCPADVSARQRTVCRLLFYRHSPHANRFHSHYDRCSAHHDPAHSQGNRPYQTIVP